MKMSNQLSLDDPAVRLLVWGEDAARHGKYAGDVPVQKFLNRIAAAWDKFAVDASGALTPPLTDENKAGIERLVGGDNWSRNQLSYALRRLAELIDPAWAHAQNRAPTETDFVQGLSNDLRHGLQFRKEVGTRLARIDGTDPSKVLEAAAADCH
jgi:hypothetical protein